VIIPRKVFPSVVEEAWLWTSGVWRANASLHEGEPKLRYPWFAAHPPAGPRVALAVWCATRTCNPSIVETDGMTSEGVGSYWPFATGRRVDQANLLLKQFAENTRMRHVICPNQHIASGASDSMPQWIAA